VLFDSGATHSFVSSLHVGKLGLNKFVSIKNDVITPSGELFECTKLFEDTSFVIGGVTLTIDLVEFPLEEFDVIVGMDWLSRYKATIDCVQKKVSLKGPKGVHVSYRGFVERPRFKLISSVSMKALLRKGCPLILCHVRDTRVESPKVSEVEVVSDFEDVFPEEIPGYHQEGMWNLRLTWCRVRDQFLRLPTVWHYRKSRN